MGYGSRCKFPAIICLLILCLPKAVPALTAADFQIAGKALGGLPGRAILVSPQGTISSTTPAYTWNAVANSTWYGLYVQDSATNPKINKWFTAAEAGCTSGTGNCTVTPSTALALGDAKWWIQTWNDAGYGDWSDGMAFTVATASLPGKATLVSPQGTVNSNTPSFVWNAVLNSTWYGLYVQDSASNPKINKWYTAAEVGCSSGTGTCSVTPSTTLAAGAAKWWVQTWNDAGYGDWSDGMDFTVAGLAKPGKAILVSPHGTITTATPSYTWNAMTNFSWYGLYVQDSSANPKINKWYTAAEAGCSAGTGTCTVTPATVLSSGSGKWWIQTYNDIGYGDWSDGLDFVVESGRVTLVSPRGSIVTSNPTYIWNALPSAARYTLYVQDSAANPKINATYTPADVGCASGTGTCSVTAGIKLVPGSSTWKVQAHTGAASEPWSDLMNVTVSTGTVGPYGIEFVTVPAGGFQMGQLVGPGWDEVPIHPVHISQPFEMGKYEITQSQYTSILSENPSYHTGADLPVEMVSWNGAKAFVDALNSLNDGYNYRLPTEAEWEYAARAGTIGRWPFNINEVAWHGSNSSGQTHPVGTKKPNPFGLYDMQGNVSEWVRDWFDSEYYQYCVDHSLVTDPPGPASGTEKVSRGGSYNSGYNYIYLGYRSSDQPTFTGTSETRGFRVARTRRDASGYPVILATPAAVEFGGVSAGGSSEKLVTITNAGTANLVIGTVASPVHPFSKTADTCSGKTLNPSSSCTVTYRFAPTAGGSYDGTSSVASNDTGKNRLEITLNGTVSTNIIGPFGMRFVTVPAGEFQMGQDNVGPGWNELPVHCVVISGAFEMGAFEITQKNYKDVTGTNPSYTVGDTLPVGMTSWDDAQAFVDALNSRKDGYTYRLPTEAEWEYACRAGTTGNNPYDLNEVAWYDGNSSHQPHPVGTKAPNAFGLYDMLGNVEEWVRDWYDDTYYQFCVDNGIVYDPPGPASGAEKVSRGGGYGSSGNYVMPGHRASDATGFSGTSEARGFRIVRTR